MVVFTLLSPCGVLADTPIIDKEYVSESDCSITEDGYFEFTRHMNANELDIEAANNEFVSETVIVVPESKAKRKEILCDLLMAKSSVYQSLSSGGNKYRYKWDKTGTVKGWSTVYYKTLKHKKGNYAYITKVTGGYKSEGNGVGVKTHKVLIGQIGRIKSNYAYKGQQKTYSLNSKSWTKIPPKSWEPVCVDEAPYGIGCNYDLKLYRAPNSKKTWNLSITNNVYNKGIEFQW